MVKKEAKHKVVGTFAPIFSLTSSQQSSKDQGTFETGLIFLDWLKKTKQSAWQILPLNETQLEKGSPTKHVPSPYKGYGIGLASRYASSTYTTLQPSLEQKNDFLLKHKNWLEDYALFCSIRDVYGTDDWRLWDKSFRNREKGVLKEWAKKHKTQINYYIVNQWQLHQSYTELHKKAKELGILLIGDFPYYLSLQSPLVWAHQRAFHINKDGSLSYVSGIPDVRRSYFGRQVWGHPLYNWEEKDAVMNLWKVRLDYQGMLFDDVRFDHAKAFFAFGKMDLENAANDSYVDGPGEGVFRELVSYAREKGITFFAEDSGEVTGGLINCLNDMHIAGIKILHFALKPNEEEVNENYIHIGRYPDNCVAYTTSHDTLPLIGYLHQLSVKQKKKLAQASSVPYSAIDMVFAKNLRDAVIASPAKIIVIPIQDWLLTIDRINTPGTEKEVGDTNWRYKIGMTVEKLPATVGLT